jgi:hypothetical protein
MLVAYESKQSACADQNDSLSIARNLLLLCVWSRF